MTSSIYFTEGDMNNIIRPHEDPMVIIEDIAAETTPWKRKSRSHHTIRNSTSGIYMPSMP